MRKLKLQVQMTVNGFIAGPSGEMDFMIWNWDEALNNYVAEITEPVDCIVLGRKLAEGFIPYWADVAANPNNPQVDAGIKFTQTHKVVFTKSLEQSPWNNTVLARGDLATEINALKAREGRDIIAYGGATFVSSLIKASLIDEYHLFINPGAIGKGMPVFNDLENRLDLRLVSSTAFDCGIVVLTYTPKRD
jgi:dihydrofolate reductase